MKEITTITINGETYTLRDSVAEELLGDVAAVLDEINGEVI